MITLRQSYRTDNIADDDPLHKNHQLDRYEKWLFKIILTDWRLMMYNQPISSTSNSTTSLIVAIYCVTHNRRRTTGIITAADTIACLTHSII